MESQFYKSELKALKKSGILRTRAVFEGGFADFASNDYLGLANNKKLIKKACKLACDARFFAPRASMLINGYSKLHKKLESRLAKANGFEDCIVVGSGFLGNVALIESLVRKKDTIFIDEDYHASGILGAKLVQNAVFFKHNDCADLESKILALESAESARDSSDSVESDSKDSTESRDSKHPADSHRILIAIEGIYSMSGDIAHKNFAKIAQKYNAILIVDEAHSSGVLGRNLLGYFDFHGIKIAPNFIKLGTFSKAYGSYGAYILASRHICKFLISRAKPIIYSTALSPLDTALSLVNFDFITRHAAKFHAAIESRKKIIAKKLKIQPNSQIFSIQFQNQNEMLRVFGALKKHGILVGAIRKPTVKTPTIRAILSTKHSKKDIKKLCDLLKKFLA